jgi:hypothetical protein
MSFYDDASLIFLAGGAAGKDGKIYNLKPTGRVTTRNFVDNGTFDSSTNWVADAGWTIEDGKASTTGAQISSIDLVQTTTYANLAEGRPYKLQYTVSNYTAGTLSAFVRGTAAGTASADGTYTEYATAGSDTDAIKFTANSTFRGKIDDVSIVEVESIPADFTFTRGTNLTATRVGKDGYIEKGRENLLLQSNQFDTTWSQNDVSVTSSQAGYDGTNDAWLVTKTASSNSYLRQNFTAFNDVRTFSVYAKAGTLSGINIQARGSVTYSAQFDLSDGSTGSDANEIVSNISSVGNGWWRCSVTFDASSADQVRIFVCTDGLTVGSTAGTIYIQDAQLEQGLVATDYIETGASTATAGLLEDEPRFDYTGGGCPALLMEPARTNLIEQSEYFDHTSWIDTSATRDITVTQVSETTPDGGSVAYKIQGTALTHQLAALNTIVIGDVVTNSIYVKRVSGTGDVRLRDVENVGTLFSLSAADGWKRIDVTTTATSTNGRFYVNLETYTDEILVWGAQQEKSDFVTSYIPTYGSSATRDQDVTAELEHGITMGTTCSVFFEGKHLAPNITQLSFFQLRTNDSNRLLIYGSASASSTYNLIVQHRVSGTSTTNSTAKALNIGDSFKVLVRMDDTTMDVFINGELHFTGTIVAQDHFGKMNLYRTGATDQSGHEVSQAILFTTALSNNDSEILTGATSYRSFNVMASALNYTAYE